MRVKVIAAAAAFAAFALSGMSSFAGVTFTWEPSDGNWDTTTGNWNDGTSSGVAWVDNASDPNDAVFGSSAARKSVTVGSTRYVNDLTVDGSYMFNGAGPISVAGTLTLTGVGSNFNTPLTSRREDGSLHIAAASAWNTGYFTGANQQSATYFEGRVYFSPGSDAVFGLLPNQPTDNIFVSGTNTIYGNVACTINGNRTIKISSGSGLEMGGSAQLTYNNMIRHVCHNPKRRKLDKPRHVRSRSRAHERLRTTSHIRQTQACERRDGRDRAVWPHWRECRSLRQGR